MESNIAAWMISGGQDPQEARHERERAHRQALREARLATGEPARLGRLMESVRNALAPASARPVEPNCCPA